MYPSKRYIQPFFRHEETGKSRRYGSMISHGYVYIEGTGGTPMDETSNPLRFETNPYHNVILKDRKVLELTGVKQIDSFDANEFLMETAQGWMVVQGKELVLGKLDTERGDVIIKGLIESISYISSKKNGGKDSVLSKIFK